MYPALTIDKEQRFYIEERTDESQINFSVSMRILNISRKGFGSNYSPKHILKLLKDMENYAFLCWKVKDRSADLVGYVVTDHTHSRLFVAYLAIDTDKCPRKGLGTQLMKKIFEKAKEINELVTLEYDKYKPGLKKFYRKFEPSKKDKSKWYQKLENPRWIRPIFEPDTSLNAISKRI